MEKYLITLSSAIDITEYEIKNCKSKEGKELLKELQNDSYIDKAVHSLTEYFNLIDLIREVTEGEYVMYDDCMGFELWG